MLLHHLVAELKNSIDEARSINEELQKQYTSLQETLEKVKAEKLVGDLSLWLNVFLLLLWHSVLKSFIKMQDALHALDEEKDARISAESMQNKLLEDLKRIKLEETRLNDQV